MTDKPTALWDLPTRVFHWSIVVLVPAAWLTAETGNFDAHQWIGFTVIVLVATRLAWGVVGSRHSRFTDFLTGPRRVLGYVRGNVEAGAGHNPLGGWGVMAMLALLALQSISGLYNNEDAVFEGPLYYGAEPALREVMHSIHEVAFNVLLALIGLHIAAVLYHQLRRGEKLIQAMWRGSAPGREGRATPVPFWLALVLLSVAAVLLWWGLEQAPRPDPGRWG